MKKTYIYVILPVAIPFAILINGCVSQIPSLDDFRKGWIGSSIDELREAYSLPSGNDEYAKEIGWKETTYKLENGNWVYIGLAGRNCFIHWEVNPKGILVDSKLDGEGCKGR